MRIITFPFGTFLNLLPGRWHSNADAQLSAHRRDTFDVNFSGMLQKSSNILNILLKGN